MDKLIFYIMDVFAERKYTGNQLAVFRGANALSDAEMQSIAREFNFSETTFILSDDKRDGGYDVRIFTPSEEVPFAGHPSLGTAFVIQREIVREPIGTVVLNLGCGQIPVIMDHSGKDVLWMRQMPPTFGRVFSPQVVSQVLNIDIRELDTRFPVQEVSTGLPFIIVPLKTLEGLKAVRINRERYFELIQNAQAKAILVFCPQKYHQENDMNVRVFAEHFGVPEDPATGSANGCLGGYLVKHNYFGKDRIGIRVEQGFEIGRPSLLQLRAESKEGKIDISIGGKVVMVARGEFI